MKVICQRCSKCNIVCAETRPRLLSIQSRRHEHHQTHTQNSPTWKQKGTKNGTHHLTGCSSRSPLASQAAHTVDVGAATAVGVAPTTTAWMTTLPAKAALTTLASPSLLHLSHKMQSKSKSQICDLLSVFEKYFHSCTQWFLMADIPHHPTPPPPFLHSSITCKVKQSQQVESSWLGCSTTVQKLSTQKSQWPTFKTTTHHWATLSPSPTLPMLCCPPLSSPMPAGGAGGGCMGGAPPLAPRIWGSPPWPCPPRMPMLLGPPWKPLGPSPRMLLCNTQHFGNYLGKISKTLIFTF